MVAEPGWDFWLMTGLLMCAILTGIRRDRSIACAAMLIAPLVLSGWPAMQAHWGPFWKITAAMIALLGLASIAMTSRARWPLVVAALAAISFWLVFWVEVGVGPPQASLSLLRGCLIVMTFTALIAGMPARRPAQGGPEPMGMPPAK